MTISSSSASAASQDFVLTARIEKLLQEEYEQQEQTDQSTSKRAIMIADILAEKYESIGQSWLLHTIGEELAKLYRQRGIRCWQWVSDFLPDKYKNPNNIIGQSYATSDVTRLDFYKKHLEEIESFQKTIGDIPDSSISDLHKYQAQLAEKYKQSTNALAKKAELHNIALEANADKGNESNDQQVNMDKSRPRGSIIQDAFIEASNVFKDISDRVYEFPDEILRREQEIADGVYTFLSLFDSALDLKYSQDWLNWFQAEKYRDIFGKHAAGVLSFSVTNLCRNCSDEEHNEWVRMEPVETEVYDTYNCLQCHAQIKTKCTNCNLPMRLQDKAMVGWQCTECGGTTPIQRDLTREQIGDKSSIVVEAAEQVIERIPVLMSFFAWYRDSIKPLVAGRKTRLSNKLSAKA